jgi:hypothetical protein
MGHLAYSKLAQGGSMLPMVVDFPEVLLVCDAFD